MQSLFLEGPFWCPSRGWGLPRSPDLGSSPHSPQHHSTSGITFRCHPEAATLVSPGSSHLRIWGTG